MVRAPLRSAALLLWFGAAAVCLVRALAQGFTCESFGFALWVHNGLNPYCYDFGGTTRAGFSVVMSVVLVTSCILVKPGKVADLILFSLAVLSYVAAFTRLWHVLTLG